MLAAPGSRSVPRVPWQVKYALLVLIWGSSFLLMKVGLEALAPVQIATLRVATGVLVLVTMLRLSGARLPRGRVVWGHLVVNGFFLATLPFVMFALSETRISSALAGIGNATTPIATVLCALAFLPSEHVTGRKVLAVLVGFVGVVTIMQPWTATDRPDLVGFLMAVTGGVSYGVGWTYNRRFLAGADLGGLSQPTAVLLTGGALLLPVWLGWWAATGDDTAYPWSVHDGTSPLWLALASVVVLGAVGTGLAYMLQYDVVRGAGPTVASTMTFFLPVVSVLLGVLVLGERLAWPQLVGFGLVLLSAALVSRRARPVAVVRPGDGGRS